VLRAASWASVARPIAITVFKPFSGQGGLVARFQLSITSALQAMGLPYQLHVVHVPSDDEPAYVVVDEGALRVKLEDEVDVEVATDAIVWYALSVAVASEPGTGLGSAYEALSVVT
jgi:hypothetical protein